MRIHLGFGNIPPKINVLFVMPNGLKILLEQIAHALFSVYIVAAEDYVAVPVNSDLVIDVRTGFFQKPGFAWIICRSQNSSLSALSLCHASLFPTTIFGIIVLYSRC